MQNVISYKGELTFKILHGDKVVKTLKQHNEGTKILMNFLVKCLGSSWDSMGAPKYIRAFYAEEEDLPIEMSTEVTIRPVVSNYAPTYPDYDGAKSGVVLTFLIPSSIIDQSNGGKINRFALYDTIHSIDGNQSNYMAWIKLPDPSIEEPTEEDSVITIQGGESLMILWEMTLENKVLLSN